MFMAAIYTGTGQLLQNLQQQETHHSQFLEKSYWLLDLFLMCNVKYDILHSSDKLIDS